MTSPNKTTDKPSDRPPASPKALTGSDDAKRKATVILEAMVGVRTIQSASAELGIALPRYYVLETRMLQGMIDALEPRQRGRKRDVDAELARLIADNDRLQQEIGRLQALYRTTQRAVGVREVVQPASRSGKKKTTKTRRKITESRGERVSKALRNSTAAPEGPAATMPPETQGGQT